MKFYETTQRPDGSKLWWTARDKKGDYFEIERRGLFTKIFIAKINGERYGIYDTLIEAEQALKKWLDA